MTDAPSPSTGPIRPAAEESSRSGGAPRAAFPWASLAFLVVAITAIVGIGAVLVLASRPKEVTFVIPAGTAARIDRGEPVSVMPREVQLHVGDKVTIRNLDDRNHAAGPLSVRAGETLTHSFEQRGTFIGACTVDPGGSVSFVVT